MSAGDTMLLGLRQYLIIKALEAGCNYFEAAEAVSTTKMSHTNNDPTLRTYAEWEEHLKKGTK
jgi:hypothetical protein